MAIELIRCELKRFGLSIAKVDMIGLIPERALIESALYYMNIHQFPMDRLLSRSIQKHMDEQLVLDEENN
jgi:glutamate formiminotransferase